MNDENWYEIKGFSKYLVNPYECKVMNKESKHIMSPQITGGYPRINLNNNSGKSKGMFCHRLFFSKH